jgi:hypothetical protein
MTPGGHRFQLNSPMHQAAAYMAFRQVQKLSLSLWLL